MYRILILTAVLTLFPVLVPARIYRAPVPQVPGTLLRYETVAGGSRTSSTSEVLSVSEKDGTCTVIISNTVQMPEDSPFSENKSETRYVLSDGSWYADTISEMEAAMKSMLKSVLEMSGEDISDMPEPEIGIKGSNTVFPEVMEPGQKVEISPLEITVRISPITIRNTVKTVRYECTGTETVTVPAGTFSTYVIESETRTSIKVMGMGKTVNTTEKTWFCPGTGMVRKQTFNGKKLESETVLVSVTDK